MSCAAGSAPAGQGGGGGVRTASRGVSLRGPGLSGGVRLSLERSVELRWGFAEEAPLGLEPAGVV